MSALYGNKSVNFTKLPLAFCNGFTLKRDVYWNRGTILQAGTVVSPTIVEFYKDIALNIPVSIRMDEATVRMEQRLYENMAEFKKQNASRTNMEITLSDGNILMKEGDTENQDCFILTKGILSISINDVVIANISDHGMPVGEMSFLTGEARSATVTAKGSTKVLRLQKKDKNKILRNNPTITMTILEALVSRLNDNNKKVVEMNKKMTNSTNKALVQAEKLEQNYQTVVRTLMRETGIKRGNLDILEKMLEVLEENLGSKLKSGSTHSVYMMFLDFVDYYRKQAISECVESIQLKDNMSKIMRDLF